MRRQTQQKRLIPTILLIYFLLYYRLCPGGSARCTHATERQWVMTKRESQQEWLVREKWGIYQREAEENLCTIMKEAPQAQFARESPPSQGTLPLTQMRFPQSTEGHYSNNQSQKRLLEVKQIKVQIQSYKCLKTPDQLIPR